MIEVIPIETLPGIELSLCIQPSTAEVLDKLRDRNSFLASHEVGTLFDDQLTMDMSGTGKSVIPRPGYS
jgi:hypothetical protein